MSTLALVIYGRGSGPARAQAANELYRRKHDKYARRGLVPLTPDERAILEAEPADEPTSPAEADVVPDPGI